MSSSRVAWLAAVVCGVTGLSCGSDEPGREPDEKPVVVREDVTVLDASMGERLLAVATDGTLRFSGGPTGLEALGVGRVIVSAPTRAAPFGLLRRITAVETSGSELVVHTKRARLMEVFQQAEIHVELPVSDANMLAQAPALPGAFTVPLGFLIKDLDGNPATTKDQLRMEGSVGVDAGWKVDWTIFDSDKLFDDLNPFDSVDLEVEASFHASQSLELKVVMPHSYDLAAEIELPPTYYEPVVFFIGPVPVVLTPKSQLYVGGAGAAFPGGSPQWPQRTFGVKEKLGLSVGAQCAVTDGCDAWGNVTKDASAILPEFGSYPGSVTAVVKGYVGIRFELLVYWLAGPYGELEPYVRMNDTFPGNPAWTLEGGIDANAGLVMDILGFDYSKHVLNKEWTLAKGDGSAGNTPPHISFVQPADQAKVQVNAPVQLRVSRWDLEEGAGCCAVQVVSSVDGALGNPNSVGLITKTFTTLGARTITATVTDNQGLKDTATVTVIVQNSAPDATIVQPGPGSTHYRGVPFMILGVATDGNETGGKLACDKITWSGFAGGDNVPANRCGAASDGIQWATYASSGSKTLTLTATDPQGASDTASVGLSIVEPPSDIPPTVVVLSPQTKDLTIGIANSQMLLRFRTFDPDDASGTFNWKAYWNCVPGTNACSSSATIVSGALSGLSAAGGAVRQDTWSVFNTVPSTTCGDSYYGYLELFVASGGGGMGSETLFGFPFRVTSPTC